MSCQPALVYEAVIDTKAPEDSYTMTPFGHSHYSGKTGEIYTESQHSDNCNENCRIGNS